MALRKTTLKAILTKATDGLLYLSESDYPFTYVQSRKRQEPDTSPAEILQQAVGHQPQGEIEEVAFTEWFGRLTQAQEWHTEEDKATVERYRHLQKVLKKYLTDLRVYRVGEIEVTIYVLGRTKQGRWAGLKTTAIET